MNVGASTIEAIPMSKEWLRSRPFDMTLILGVTSLALCSGWVVNSWPKLFIPVLILDLWILGYHHVVATFTRIAFDKESLQQHKFLVFGAPLLIIAVAGTCVFIWGPWILASTYLYWQWFHYTRQSYGIARIYQVKEDPKSLKADQAAIYLLPLAGIMYRYYQDPEIFLGIQLKCFPVPFWAFQIVFILAVFSIVSWFIKEIGLVQKGRSSLAYRLYMMCHIIIFCVGYLVLDKIDHGWLVLNVWHNAQYILFVWMFNNKRFQQGIDPRHRFLSTISQTKNQWQYYGFCLSLSTILY